MLENVRANTVNFNINNPLKPLILNLVGSERDLPIERVRLGLIKTCIWRYTVSPEDVRIYTDAVSSCPALNLQFACSVVRLVHEDREQWPSNIYGCSGCSHLWKFSSNYSLRFFSKDTLVVRILWGSCSDVFCTKRSRRENRIEIIKLYMNHTFVF